MHHLNPHHGIGVTGCSFGAYHAMIFALRQPYVFQSCVTMGGAFDVSQFLNGYFNEDCYFLNPPSFLPNLSDAHYLDQYRRNKWVLVTGEHDICRAANESFSGLLHYKGIPHSLHIVGSRLEARLARLAAHGGRLPSLSGRQAARTKNEGRSAKNGTEN